MIYDKKNMIYGNSELLVGGIPTPLKNMKVNWDDEIPNTWKIKVMFQSPPTSLLLTPISSGSILSI